MVRWGGSAKAEREVILNCGIARTWVHLLGEGILHRGLENMKIHRQESAEGYRLHYDCDKGCFWDAAQDSCGWKVDHAQVERALNAML